MQQQYDPDIFRKNMELQHQLDRAEAEIKILLNKNNEVIERCNAIYFRSTPSYNHIFSIKSIEVSLHSEILKSWICNFLLR